MMRPMKLAGSQLLFGEGCLAHLKDINTKRAFIVTGGQSMFKNGIYDKVESYLKEAGVAVKSFSGVEPDPSYETVMKGTKAMQEFEPDLIVALGGGSPMDAAKAMWVYYEHPQFKTLEDLLNANPFPKLRNKAILCCIPSTAGSASEVSRSIVISTSDGSKHGFGHMELMPDIAICDPEVTLSMPPRITAETGMDAMTHALEALVSRRANYVSDILARGAIKDIAQYLPMAYKDGQNLQVRERMLNASMVAGLAFTNVSLGLVHSMAHTVGSLYGLPHGLSDAIILPYIIDFNRADKRADSLYKEVEQELGVSSLADTIRELNDYLGIAPSLSELIKDKDDYMSRLSQMSEIALADGCTKTNPIIPDDKTMQELFVKVYHANSKLKP